MNKEKRNKKIFLLRYDIKNNLTPYPIREIFSIVNVGSARFTLSSLVALTVFVYQNVYLFQIFINNLLR